MDNLKTLQTWLKTLGKEYTLDELKNLGHLSLSNNNLTSIPKEIRELKKLEWLYLYNNNLTSLPKEIGELKNLKWLSLRHNNLTSLPKEIGELKNLKYIYFSNNNFTITEKTIENYPKIVQDELRKHYKIHRHCKLAELLEEV